METAAAVRAGTSTARSQVESALLRIERTQPLTNAWQVIRSRTALAEADDVDARADRARLPLAGVPVAIKDNIAVTGEPLRDGSLASSPAPQTADHEVVRRLRAAGAVVVGITRVPELCLWGATDSRFGVTRNPWDLDRTPGGSSGGSAAAVAAGDVPIAHGNDGLGSIRIPAACCGLVGIKPGLGVVPAGIGANSWNGTAENGPLATTVADLALTYSVMAADPAAATVVEPGSLRVSWSSTSPVAGMTTAGPWANAARSTADLLTEAGHAVAPRTPSYPASLLTTTALRFWTIDAAEDADLFDDPSLLEPRNRRHVRIGRALARRGLPEAARERWRARAEAFFADADVLLTPTLAHTPLKAKQWSTSGWLQSLLANVRYAPFAAPWNFLGWPAMSVPAGVDKDGRPLGVQLVGRPGTERTLLGLALQIEQRRPWPRTASL